MKFILFFTFVPLLLTTVYPHSLIYSCQNSKFCICKHNDNNNVSYICMTKTNHQELLTIAKDDYYDEEFFSATCDGTNSSELFRNLPKLNLQYLYSGRVTLNQCLLTEKPLVILASDVLDINYTYFIEYTVRGIKNIPIVRDHLKGLKNLFRFHFEDKSQTSLPEDLFEDLKDLGSLSITTEVEFLPLKFFSGLTKLNSIELSMPLINLDNFQWPDAFESLFFNRLVSETFPNDLFANKKYLRRVAYTKSSTFLTTNITENMFKDSVNIIIIDLSGNQLKTLPDRLFYDQKLLQKLFLNHNHLSEISDDLFIDKYELMQLDLSYNHLVTISR